MYLVCDSVYATTTFQCGSRCNALQYSQFLYAFGNPTTDAAGYIALDTEKEQIVVTFRGSKSLRSYYLDSHIWKIHPSWLPTISYDSLIHAGFQKVYLSIREPLMKELKEISRYNPSFAIHFTGHSLGGSLAVLAAADFYLETKYNGLEVTTFGQPRLGNLAFSNWINTLNIKIHRVTATGDIVTMLPPQLFGYHHTNDEYRILNGKTYQCDGGCNHLPSLNFTTHPLGYYNGDCESLFQQC
ncbi:Alpha/Beta hydrolase protein [Globomyces pollinis-pini]|nr:Alpha/Beta hydrolase protein [Globomyces pollinis-pini]